MKKIVFIATLFFYFLISQAWAETHWFSSGGSNPYGRIYCEIRDSIAVIVPPPYQYNVTNPWDDHGYYADYKPAGNVVIPSHITFNGISYPVRRIEAKALYDCCWISSITIPYTVVYICNDAFGHFSFASALSSVFYTGTITQWCSIYFENEFANPVTNSHSLTINGSTITGHLIIPDDVSVIYPFAFFNCTTLTSVTIPTGVITINEFSFGNCTSLTTVYYNAKHCNMGSNRYQVFSGCTYLNTVFIGDSVQYIDTWAFQYVHSLNKVYLAPLTPPIVSSTSFGSNASNRVFILSGCSYEDYYNSSSWSTYQDALRDPIIDITVHASSNNTQQGTVTFIRQRNNIVHCDSTAVVQANAATGYRFDHWSDGSTNNPYTIHLTGDTTVIAYFATGTQDIEDVEGNDIPIYVANGHIVVDGVEGETVHLFDIMGRNIRNEELPTGVYLVKVGNRHVRKVIVRR